MGDTFRRISLGQRRKLSTCANPTESRSRKRSIFERVVPIETADLKPSRPSIKAAESERPYKLPNTINSQDSCTSKFDKASIAESKGRQNILSGVFACLKNFLRDHEILVQVSIVLPIVLTALYILLIEKGPLILEKTN